jgi:hypothetical protein
LLYAFLMTQHLVAFVVDMLNSKSRWIPGSLKNSYCFFAIDVSLGRLNSENWVE